MNLSYFNKDRIRSVQNYINILCRLLVCRIFHSTLYYFLAKTPCIIQTANMAIITFLVIFDFIVLLFYETARSA